MHHTVVALVEDKPGVLEREVVGALERVPLGGGVGVVIEGAAARPAAAQHLRSDEDVRPVAARADVKLPAIFSDHMVLQQNTAIKIWGWADPLETVVVRIGGQVEGTAADKDGKWSVKLPKKFKAGDPDIERMEALNPKTAAQRKDEEETRRFLQGR